MILNKFLEPRMVTMTREEFSNYYDFKYGNRELQINKRLTTLFTIVLANLIWINKAFAAKNLTKVDNVGMTLLEIARNYGYWAFLIIASVEILKNAMESGGTKDSGKIIIKYVIGYGSLYFLPWIFDLIKELLS